MLPDLITDLSVVNLVLHNKGNIIEAEVIFIEKMDKRNRNKRPN